MVLDKYEGKKRFKIFKNLKPFIKIILSMQKLSQHAV